ncbi:MAG: HD domain-containing protein [Candidatus Pacebacteria bacterium]|jgi:(p)ppGpp synthase/HD superfamily hydrolase|nr:HD domain-containing protein [Candidatus Paceibacterota bacterium]
MKYSYRVEQAIRAAAILHKDQVRKGAQALPYVTHLFAVATIASDYTDEEDVIIAALLHDTIEDTDYTPEELQADFGGPVKDMVLAVSEPLLPEGRAHDWHLKKKTYIKQLKKAPIGSLIVAAADKIHNMRCVVEEYYDAHDKFVADFGGSLEDRVLLYQEISNILNRRLENEILSEFNYVFDEYKKFIDHVQKEAEKF